MPIANRNASVIGFLVPGIFILSFLLLRLFENHDPYTLTESKTGKTNRGGEVQPTDTFPAGIASQNMFDTGGAPTNTDKDETDPVVDFTEADAVARAFGSDAIATFESLYEAAARGSARAATKLGILFGSCRDFLPKSEIENSYSRNAIDEQSRSELLETNARCTSLAEQTKSEMRIEEQKWFERARTEGDPLAKAVYLSQQKMLGGVDQTIDYDSEQHRLAIRNAVKRSGGDLMYLSALAHQLALFHNLNSDSISEEQKMSLGYKKGATREALTLLQCDYSIGCDRASMKQHYSQSNYYTYELEDIKLAYNSMKVALRSGDATHIPFLTEE